MKRGTIFAICGLFVGLALGAGILWIKSFAGQQLMDVLEMEVKGACPCELRYDSVEISLLRLTAWGTNVRIVENGQDKLFFPKAEADFSIKRLSEHKIDLSELRLFNGISYGVGPDSATFKFVDYLAAPIPPERDTPDRWKLKLQKLKLFNSSFVERIGTSELSGTGVGLSLERTPSNDFQLFPSIESIFFKKGAHEPLNIGSIKADLYIDDDFVRFTKISIQRKKAEIHINAISHTNRGNALDGSVSYSFDSASLDLPEWLQASLQGKAHLSGSIDSPQAKGELSNSPDSEILLSRLDPLVIDLDTFQSKYETGFTKNKSHLNFTEMTASGPNLSLSLLSPFSLTDDSISGNFSVKADSLAVDDILLDGVDLTLNVSGALSDPSVQVKGVTQKLTAAAIDLGALDFNAEVTPRALHFEVKSIQSQALAAAGTLKLATSPQGMDTLENLSVELKNLPLPANEHPAGFLTLSSKITGPFAKEALVGSGNVQLITAPRLGAQTIDGSFSLEKGKINASFQSFDDRLKASLVLPLATQQPGRFSLDGQDLVLYKEEAGTDTEARECAYVSVNAEYNFHFDKALYGDGSITIPRFELGCEPYFIKLDAPRVIPIKNGSFNLGTLHFEGTNTTLEVSGTITPASTVDVVAQGSLELSALSPLFPSVDDIRGHVEMNVEVKGTLDAPLLQGKVDVKSTGLDIASADLSLQNFGGVMDIEGQRIKLNNLHGTCNGGTCTLKGEVNPFSIAQSDVELEVAHLQFEPSQDISLVMSGNFALAQEETVGATVKGNVLIENVEFEKNIDLVNLLRTLTQSIFRSLPQQLSERSGNMPGLNFDLNVEAPGNIFVSTNWAQAELQAHAAVAGTLSNPEINGKLEILSGWFGIKDRRFEITSGQVAFRPGSYDPTIDIVGEANLRSRDGQSALVICEIQGTLSDPHVLLSSDRGLTDREILNLITSSGDLTSTTQIGTVAQDVSIDVLPFIDESSFLGLGKFFKTLTKIDSISLEPTFNPQRGVEEPSIVAKKRLLRNVYILGESAFGSTGTDSRARLVYEVTPKLKVAGIVINEAGKPRNSVGADVIYTILSDQKNFIDITIGGTKETDEDDLRDALKISENSRVRLVDLERLNERVEAWLHSRGYLDAEVQATCGETKNDGDGFCHDLRVQVSEGAQAYIAETIFKGDAPPPEIKAERLKRALEGAVASEQTQKEAIDELIRKLRAEGFLAARVNGSYIPSTASNDTSALNVDLVLELSVGAPVSFLFEGNTKFNAETFLNSIKLFSRKQPFGSNTISILMQNIEQLYHDAGYLDIKVSSSKTQAPDGRIVYTVSIEEGSPIKVAKVNLHGNHAISSRRLRRKVRSISYENEQSIFSPKFANRNDVEANAELIKSLYIEEGYPQVSVTTEIVKNSERKAEITYQVDEGQAVQARTIDIIGMPEDERFPITTKPPYSIPKINRYVQDLLDKLSQVGYMYASVETNFENDHLSINVQSGPRTFIGKIQVEGNAAIPTLTIVENLTFAEGDAWQNDHLQTTRKKLLKLGLFTRVEIRPSDGELNASTEDMLIQVVERPLQTLEVGTGVNSEYGIHIFSIASDRSLFLDGRSLSLKVDGYFDETENNVSQGLAGLTYADPAFLKSNYGMVSDLRYQRLDLSTLPFDLDRISFSSILNRSWEQDISASAGYTFHIENLDNVDAGAVLSEFDQGTTRLGFLLGTITYDKRDDPLNPHRGFSLSADTQLASEAFGSEANYYSTGGKASFLWPIPYFQRRFTIAMNARAASAWTYAGDSFVPITQRFFLGGRNSVRGFSENSLGPRGDDDSVIGGDLLFAENAELQYLIAEAIETHVFFDAGTVYIKKQEIDLDEIRTSSGFGARYLSPIGPIGVDVGFPIDRESGESVYKIHFNIGTNF